MQRAKRSPQLGYLTVDADPWATVFVDGKKLGDTPIAGYPLAPGEVVVVWKNPDTGKTRRRTVKILSGKRHYLRETLR